MIRTILRKLLRHTEGKQTTYKQNDMHNVVNSMFNSQPLYDRLKVICHPDRFPNDEQKRQQAEALFQALQKNRYNIESLKQIEVKINKLLE